MVIREEIENIERLREILEIFLEAGFSELLERTELQKNLPLLERLLKDKDVEPSPVRLRKALEELGPTFIKLGQVLAQRPDLVPERYIDELAGLEDHVAPVDTEEVLAVIEERLGEDPDDIFQEFDEEPLASASIAQVHRAVLESGDEVAVKVRKPGVKQQVQTDLRIMRRLIREAEFASTYVKNMQVSEIFEQFERWTRDELNLEREATNAERLAANLAQDDGVNLPEIYWDYVTEAVLVEEYLEGTKLTDIERLEEKGIDIRDATRNGIHLIFKQVLRDGFFHADPHPANVLVDDDGNIVYLDFGIMGQISPHDRRHLTLMMLHAADGDAEAVVNSFRKISKIDTDADIEGFTTTVERYLLEMKDKSISEEPFSYSILKIIKSAADHGIVVPTELVAAGKGLVQAEGVGLSVYPDFKPEEELVPLLNRLVFQQNRPDDIFRRFMLNILDNRELIEEAPQNLADLLKATDRTSSQLSASRSISINTRKIIGGLLASVLILSGSLVLALSTQSVVQGLALTEIVLGVFIGIMTLR